MVGGVVDDPPAGGEHHHVAIGEQLVEHFALDAAVVGLAVGSEDLGEGEPGGFFDLFVELDEAGLELLGEGFADRGFAGAAHTEEGDRAGF